MYNALLIKTTGVRLRDYRPGYEKWPLDAFGKVIVWRMFDPASTVDADADAHGPPDLSTNETDTVIYSNVTDLYPVTEVGVDPSGRDDCGQRKSATFACLVHEWCKDQLRRCDGSNS
jgi:hypothetical protein